MPDIDPAALSRPSVSLSTPILSNKTLAGTISGAPKIAKSSQIIPARIDLEPLYTALKAAIGNEKWAIYKESTTEFLIGRLNQTEYSERIDPILAGPGDKEHLHNNLIAAIYGNVTREMPDQGLAPWVSANDKPAATTGTKPVSGDATERRLKGDVMQLPTRDRRRIKDLVQNDWDPHESISNIFADTRRKLSTVTDATPTVGGINNMNFDLEIRKRYAQPLAVESGEFPDINMISGRMLPSCYEAGLVNGHTVDAPQFLSVAVETFIKEVLTQVFSRTRSNGPGESGSAGFGVGTTWIQTHKYKRQLEYEEEAAIRGEISRDKSGLLPIESRAASERGPLGMSDLRLSLEMADTGMAQFPVLMTQVIYGYREGELENWDDYTWVCDQPPEAYTDEKHDSEANGGHVFELANGYPDAMDIDTEAWWEGAESQDADMLDGILDSCLAAGS
ncbi:transcriptional coactivator HFI1/ADA1 [Fusarium oxysporum f. sp. raphani 54005]|uniref:Transcriptional coactivator HFI1/ADA1 n=19 Tax=Fusarium oxysporum species complex TaxID=171631 RepID=X0CA24_FUSOX|nr:transcriptional coactivator HFI1/ADA1 [Fusarium oxysporum f. sp. lycopersici 4287]XP_031063403.1 transcriptional coactivator HFI1/ADA1 [Fusarium odoratissimum NRRL 54006]EWZ89621.1 transcriptional coactivator HFI1/ADA1 [Fusarium oxysporum f. sp. lycopersici MN25]EXA45315.1 transcriptional coactivator HFI1/ADA1 [Fusarium oxysporum f. sp. pisi HDV247]EXK39768.1 transcriptional coactivator HFI1/ADA1 [Fusarium oxysporum f. sp. melonis 26406]EXK91265.1 transcriptional coactivator HFI1/ADA1 [Fusa